jgi:hypothetical protein
MTSQHPMTVPEPDAFTNAAPNETAGSCRGECPVRRATRPASRWRRTIGPRPAFACPRIQAPRHSPLRNLFAAPPEPGMAMQ